jgi:hypothetical protein
MQNFGTLQQSPLNPQICVAHAKFKTIQQPRWREQEQEEKKKKKIDTKNSGLPKFAPLVARTSLGLTI